MWVFGAAWYGKEWPHYHPDYPNAEATRCGCGNTWADVTPFAKHANHMHGNENLPSPPLVVLYTADSGASLDMAPNNPRAVFLVLEHMRNRWENDESETASGWRIECGEVWAVSVIDSHLEQVGEWRYSPSLGRATFECALLAAQEMEREG